MTVVLFTCIKYSQIYDVIENMRTAWFYYSKQYLKKFFFFETTEKDNSWVKKTDNKLLVFLKECFHVILAGVSDLPEIVELKFDHVFFTGIHSIFCLTHISMCLMVWSILNMFSTPSGNREDGSRIAVAAARTLTPVTLVLGGKNPCYVDQHCDIATTVQRIAWARFHNGGQSIMAPSYILCHTDVKARLVQALKCCLMQFYGPDPRESRSFGRMVNLEVFNRTRELLWRSGKVVVGGQVTEAEKYIGKNLHHWLPIE